MKKLLKAILTVTAVAVCAVGLTACTKGDTAETESEWGNTYTVSAAYKMAADLGYNGTLEEFIASISGQDGKDGQDGVGIKNVEFNSERELIVIYTDDKTVNLGKITAECQHNFSDWTVAAEATCTSIGYETRNCSDCNYTEYKFNQATGHLWDEGTVVNGTNLLVYTCEKCDETKVVINVTGDNGTEGGNEGNNGNEGEFKDLIMPVDEVIVLNKYDFIKNELIGQYRVHQGIDFGCVAGTNVYSVLDGTVSKIVKDSKIGENYVTVSHENGLTTTYTYIEAFDNLKVGDTVKQGDVLGIVAAAGGYEADAGVHLHFAINVNGKAVDPEMYLDIKENQ